MKPEGVKSMDKLEVYQYLIQILQCIYSTFIQPKPHLFF